MLQLGPFTNLQPLVETELPRAREARFGRVSGRIEWDERRVGLEARAFAEVEMARVGAWCDVVGSGGERVRVEGGGGGGDGGD